jgi:hypothetical protein
MGSEELLFIDGYQCCEKWVFEIHQGQTRYCKEGRKSLAKEGIS